MPLLGEIVKILFDYSSLTGFELDFQIDVAVPGFHASLNVLAIATVLGRSRCADFAGKLKMDLYESELCASAVIATPTLPVKPFCTEDYAIRDHRPGSVALLADILAA